MDDWQQALDDAIASRRVCRVARPGGQWSAGVLCRAESAGLVADVPGHDLRDGEGVRLWFEAGGEPRLLEASVLRLGVPVPSRGADGVMLGFLAECTPSASATGAAPAPRAPGPILRVRLPGGGGLSLLDPPVRLVDLSVARVAFEVPRRFPIVFPDRGTIRLRVGASRDGAYEVRGRMVGVVRGRGHALYTVDFDLVERRDLHAAAVAAIRYR